MPIWTGTTTRGALPRPLGNQAVTRAAFMEFMDDLDAKAAFLGVANVFTQGQRMTALGVGVAPPASGAAISGPVAVGSPGSTSGAGNELIQANNTSLRFANAAATGTVAAVSVNTSDQVVVGPSGNNVKLVNGGVAIVGSPGSISGATAGAVVLQNDQSLRSSNAAGSTTLRLISLNASNFVHVAQDGPVILGASGSNIGFLGNNGTAKGTVTGSRGGNAALASLLGILAGYGLVTDSSSA